MKTYIILRKLLREAIEKEIHSIELNNPIYIKEASDINRLTCIYEDEFGSVFDVQLTEAEYQGRKVELNKPFYTPDGPAKRSVYVKNDKGNVVKVNFGDKNMRIKKNDPERRKSFRARHRCDNPGPKWKPRYWSCKFW